jgi:anaerobic glycerol-3-phosphate dehydrogenase
LRYLKPLQDLHTDGELAATFMAGSGFCLPHLRQVTARLRGEALERLLQYQQERWEELRAELAEIVRKNDYRFQGEGFGAERDAWLRAVRAVVGEPGVF